MNIFSVTCFPTVSHKLIILESKENFLLSESKIADKCFKCAISEGKLNRNCNTHPNFRLWRQSSSFISSIISLLKEYKNADYFLKIEDEVVNAIPIKRILFELNQIKHIVTAHLINTEDLKQKERLVFK